VVDCLPAGYTPDLAVAAEAEKAALSAPRATLLGSPPPSCRTEIARFMDEPDDEENSTPCRPDHNYRENGPRVEISYCERKSGEGSCLSVDRVINCTAPETDWQALQDPLVTNLLARGWCGPIRCFLASMPPFEGALIDQDGCISDSLYAVGPARKGSLWESTAVPEIREQVYQLVQHLVNESRQTRPRNHTRLVPSHAEIS